MRNAFTIEVHDSVRINLLPCVRCVCVSVCLARRQTMPWTWMISRRHSRCQCHHSQHAERGNIVFAYSLIELFIYVKFIIYIFVTEFTLRHRFPHKMTMSNVKMRFTPLKRTRTAYEMAFVALRKRNRKRSHRCANRRCAYTSYTTVAAVALALCGHSVSLFLNGVPREWRVFFSVSYTILLSFDTAQRSY